MSSQINSNYCELKKNKFYAKMYDELLDEELNMNNQEHNWKIKNYLKKKINSSEFVEISNNFSTQEELMEDLILKITSQTSNSNLQGNTLMMYADDESLYELFYMEDLTCSISPDDLNEFGSITNIFLQPVCWTCGIFKTTYKSNIIMNKNELKIYSDIITKSDVAKLFISNFYHQGIMLNPDGTMIELEFTGEDPYKVIGNNYTQSNTLDLCGFNLVPWVEKVINSSNNVSEPININASKIIGSETYGRVFIGLVCPNTNKKFWNISSKTINDILSIIDSKDILEKISREIEQSEININPFYIIKKYLV